MRVDRVPAADLGGDLEAAREDHAVDLVLDPVGDDALLGQPFHALGRRHVDSVTLGRLKVARYCSLEVGRLHMNR